MYAIRSYYGDEFALCTADRPEALKTNEAKRCIQAILEGKDYFISAVYSASGTRKPVFAIAAPVKAEDSIAGVLVMVLRINYFTDLFIRNIQLDKSGFRNNFV